MSLLKYFDQRQHNGQPLFWPGSPAGFPVRGTSAPLLKKEEEDELEHVLDFSSRLFDMAKDADKKAYDEIQDLIANGWCAQRFCDRQRDPATGHYKIWLEWVQVFAERKNDGRIKRGQRAGAP